MKAGGGSRDLAARSALGVATALIGVGALAGCGSGGPSRARAGASGQQASASSTLDRERAAFTACMTKAGWNGTLVPSDSAVRTLAAQPGYEGIVAVIDRAGHSAAVAFFATGRQAEHAQEAAGASAPGNSHVSTSPGTTIAWVNYSGSTSVDSKLAGCGAAARS
jgi:hypothetical protein